MAGIEAASTSLVLGAVCAALACIFAWKNHKEQSAAHKSVGFLAMGAGLLLAAPIVALGDHGNTTFSGVAAAIGGAVGFVLLIWAGAEMKGHGHHALRTPILAFGAMVAFGSASGFIGHMAQAAPVQVTSVVHQGSSQLAHGNGG
jgi:peptidoglycan/LPS O-acetylase OafA/YrhL